MDLYFRLSVSEVYKIYNRFGAMGEVKDVENLKYSGSPLSMGGCFLRLSVDA